MKRLNRLLNARVYGTVIEAVAAMAILSLVVGAVGLLVGESIGHDAAVQHAETTPTPHVGHSVLLDLSGQGAKQTDVFSAGPTWRISWRSDNPNDFSGHFAIEIYDATTHDLAGLAGNVLVPAKQGLSDTSTGHRAGRYYLSIDGVNASWHVVVAD